MAITVEAFTGTETVSTTEHSLTTDTAGPDVDTTDGVFCAMLDLSALLAGDVFDFLVYEKAITAGTARVIDSKRFSNAQGTPIWTYISPPLGVGWDMTLDKISGTDRAITWRISQVT